MIYCWNKKYYNISLGRWIDHPQGGFSNCVRCSSLSGAMYWYKKSKVKYRQIDVRFCYGNKEPYALKWKRML